MDPTLESGSLCAVTYHFDAETRLESVDDHTWRCELTDRWNIGENPNGLAVTADRWIGL